MSSIFSATATSSSYVVNDVLSASLAGWRIATTGSPWFDDFPLESVELADGQALWTGETEHGHVAVFRSPGAVAVNLPAYFVRGGGSTVDDFSMLPATVTAVLLTVTGLLMFAMAVRPKLGWPRSMVSASVLGLATPVWTVSAESLWPHTLTVFAIGGMAYAASRDRWILVGLFGGLGLWGRLHVSVIAAAVGVGGGLSRRAVGPVLRVGLPSVALLVAAAAWSRWMYGDWDPSGGYAGVAAYAENAASGSRWDQLLNQLGLWVSPGRGLLTLTPGVVVLLPALGRAWRLLPAWSRSLAVGGLLYAVVQGFLNYFAGGAGFFGYRLTLEMLACAFPALTLSVSHAGAVARRLLPPLVALQLGVYSFGAFKDGLTMAPDEAWRVNSVVWAIATVPAFGAMLMLLMGLTVLGMRLAPSTMSWPSAAQQAEQRR